MEIRVLGCSGGIGGDAATTSFLIDGKILIDAGTGVMDLQLGEMAAIDHVFLTHSHLDHVAALPLMADSVGAMRGKPVTVHARAETLEVLRSSVFNSRLWPDFTVIPTPDEPFISLHEIAVGAETVVEGFRFRTVEMNHTVPAMGYIVSCETGSWAFSGDTTSTEEFWKVASETPDLRSLVIETTFPDEQEELANIARHLCPRLLAAELAKLDSDAEILLTHLMPGMEKEIMAQVQSHLPDRTPRPLRRDQLIRI